LLPNAQLINWNGDVYDRSADLDYIAMLRYFDLNTVVNADAQENYQKIGINTAYWQVGYEPDGVGYDPSALDPQYDVVFAAAGYSDRRRELGRLLKSQPYKTGIYGSDWGDIRTEGNTLYDFRHGCRIYRNSRIALSDDQWAARGFVSNRLFQILAAGHSLLFQQTHPGVLELLGLESGVHYVGWVDSADLVKKLAYYLDPLHEAERARGGGCKFLTRH